ncbi:MAG TPA: HAMP domain-containing sensor histidine kinase [Mucilaginibacter sp.]|jgi:signal transduction histidine kinase|nr:HAMP domain-containing sensor histidine kinase [Mucilaginibacter sp.]
MKLRARYNYVNLVTTVVVLLFTGIVYYQAISWILINQKDKALRVEEQEIFDYVNLNHQLPQTFESNDQHITFSPAVPGSVKREYIDTTYFEKWGGGQKRRHRHKAAGEYETGRGLVSAVAVGDKYYKILIVESTVETEDLIRLIFTITIAVILLLLAVLLITNRLILNRLWQPFYNIMKELRLFRLTDNRDMPKLDTNIDEFKELNAAVTDMAGRAKLDYKDLKIFTENASHELLTPIAVINSKLDSLIQTENFSERQSKLLTDLYGAVARLNRLNQSLLLLAKIENRLLHEQVGIDMKALVEETLGQFEEIFQDRLIQVKSVLAEKEIYANPYLAEVLLNNLINNAIRHNYKGGDILIELTSEKLVIQNTGDEPELKSEKIFTRFHKSSRSEGSGLGLTISKQICESYNFKLAYSFSNGYHTFTVKF